VLVAALLTGLCGRRGFTRVGDHGTPSHPRRQTCPGDEQASDNMREAGRRVARAFTGSLRV